MHKVFEVLESKRLISETDVPVINVLTKKDLTRLYGTIYRGIFDAQSERPPVATRHPGSDPFTFFAGASLRGDLSCWEPWCRIRKLEFLGRYTALYANSVTVPLPLIAPDKIDNIDQARKLLSLAAMTLLRLRPLITVGLIQPVVMRSTHCIHTTGWIHGMMSLVHDFADEASRERASKFTVVYQLPEKAPAGRSTVYIDGPPEFLNMAISF